MKYIKTWFLDEDTRMNPNLNYAQMIRGPKGQIGRHTGVLSVFFCDVITTYKKLNHTLTLI